MIQRFTSDLRVMIALLCAATMAAFSPTAAAAEKVLLAFGDSVTAGLGVALNEAWPARLEAGLRAGGINVRIINAGVSGDTSAGGRARLSWSLDGGDGKPGYAVVALGANDALRGLATEQVYDNLDAIVRELKSRGIRVLLAGMLAPPNMGQAYGDAFRDVYRRLADKHGIPLYSFLLDGVAADPALNQHDGIHPTAAGYAIITERILPAVRAFLTAP